ncbi:MAG: CTP synthase, partial [Fervidicoccaceae archaeon]
VYEVPLILAREGLPARLTETLRLEYREPELSDWRQFVERLRSANRRVRVAMVGKYTELPDSYLSIREALVHASAVVEAKVELKWIEATNVEHGKIDIEEALSDVDGGIILPGFGARGAEGKVKVLKHVREHGLPLLGICYGLQLAVVEIARNAAGLEGANSTEIDPNTPHPVVSLLEEQKTVDRLGGTMRLGAYEIELVKGTKVHELYGMDVVSERHRHRYEVNPKYLDALESSGLIVSGRDTRYGRVEFMELRGHRFYVLSQPHPEFNSKPLRPAPLFVGFLRASLEAR